MNDVSRQIRDRIDAFVGELNDLVRQAALEAVSDALRVGGGGGGSAARRSAAGPRAPRAKSARRGGKRTPAEIDTTAKQVLAYVQQNPGNGVEQMARDLATSTRDLTLPIKKLVGSGELSTQGRKRATKYFAGGAPAGGGGRKKKAAPKTAKRGRRKAKRA